MDTLFDTPETLSPKLQWIERQKFLTNHSPGCEEPWMACDPFPKDEGRTLADVMGEACVIYETSGRLAYGMSREQVIIDLAIQRGIPLWNEEGGAA